MYDNLLIVLKKKQRPTPQEYVLGSVVAIIFYAIILISQVSLIRPIIPSPDNKACFLMITG